MATRISIFATDGGWHPLEGELTAGVSKCTHTALPVRYAIDLTVYLTGRDFYISDEEVDVLLWVTTSAASRGDTRTTETPPRECAAADVRVNPNPWRQPAGGDTESAVLGTPRLLAHSSVEYRQIYKVRAATATAATDSR
jgi:subtilisin family serine protease